MSEDDDFLDDDILEDNDFDGCCHGIPWDETCSDCDEAEDELDGL